MALLNNRSFINTWADDCLYVTPSFTVVWSVLLVPLYLLVLHTGFQRWRHNKRSPVSHTDFLTYLAFSFEMFMFCGYVIASYGFLKPSDRLRTCGRHMMFLAYPGLMCCHVLTCIERYLAVVHPVVFLSLRKQKWIRARNLIIVFLWAVCALWWCILQSLKDHNLAALCLTGVLSGVIVFCSVQALRTLKNPSPASGRGVGRSRRKAFYTFFAILSAFIVWFIPDMLFYGVLHMFVAADLLCVFESAGLWFQLPSSFVLPLLFLHRAGRLAMCRGKEIKDSGLGMKRRAVS